MRLLAGALLLSACQAREPTTSARDESGLAPMRIGYQEGLGLLDCSRSAISLQPGYAAEEGRFRALVVRAERAGFGRELEQWKDAYRQAMAVADVACFPKRLADDLRQANERFERALEEHG